MLNIMFCREGISIVQRCLVIIIIMPPFKEGGAYCFAAVGRSVGRSVHQQFPFNIFKTDAQIEMKFGLQLDNDNI